MIRSPTLGIMLLNTNQDSRKESLDSEMLSRINLPAERP